MATRFASGLRATSFVEFTRDDAPADDSKWKRLIRHAAELGLPFDSPTETWLGSRPTFPDYLPAIGRSTRDPRTLYAFGHQHLGLTLAPVTGEIVAALAHNERPPVEVGPFAIDRLRLPKNRRIQQECVPLGPTADHRTIGDIVVEGLPCEVRRWGPR